MSAVAIQLPGLINNKKNIRDWVVYTIFMLIAAIYTFGYVLEIDIPNPTKLQDIIFRPINEFILKQLTSNL